MNGSYVEVEGNSWNALKITQPHFYITGESTVKLDFSLQEEAYFHLFLLDDGQNRNNDIIWFFWLTVTHDDIHKSVNYKIYTNQGEKTHYNIFIGYFLKGINSS